MANCAVVSPKSTRIPVAASLGKSVGNSSFTSISGEHAQGTRANDTKSIHTVIAVTPSGRELPYGTAETVSKKICSATVNPHVRNSCIFTKEGLNSIAGYGRNNNGDNSCRKALQSSTHNTNDSSLSYQLPDDLDFSKPSSLISSSQSSSSLSTVATLSSSQNTGSSHSTDKQTIIGLVNHRSKIPCAGNQIISCVSPKGLHNQSSAEGRSKVGIYTDWANHYLGKTRSTRHIMDLQHDVSDGVLLAEIIETITCEKITDIKYKPKTSAQMVENINTCLTHLASLGISLEGISAKDIKDGNLKTILGLFFIMSRYKQQHKVLQQHKHHKAQILSGEHQQQLKQLQHPQQQQHLQQQQHPHQQQHHQSQESATLTAVSLGQTNIHVNSNQDEWLEVAPHADVRVSHDVNVSRLPASIKQLTRAPSVPHNSSPPVAASSTSSSSPTPLSVDKDAVNLDETYSHGHNIIPSIHSAWSSPVSIRTERGRLHQNQQTQREDHIFESNNNTINSQSSSSSNNNNNNNNNHTLASTSRSPSLIPLKSHSSNSGGTRHTPTPTGLPASAGRRTPSLRSENLSERQSNRTSSSSTSSSSSSKSSTSSKLPSNSKNSMLDKFKFFKEKDKDKDKEKDKNKGVVKSSSKSSSASTASTSSRSDTDSRTSSSGTTKSSSFTSNQSSSSGDHVAVSLDESALGASSSATLSSKPAHKSGKKSAIKSSSTRKDFSDEQAICGLPPPIPSAVGLGPPTGGPYNRSLSPVVSSQRNASPTQSRKSSTKQDARLADSKLTSTTPVSLSAKKSSKISTSATIPKAQSPSVKSSKSASSAASSIPSSPSSSFIPTPSTSIPKASSGKSSGKLAKEDKARSARPDKDHRALHKDLNGSGDAKSLGASSKAQLYQYYQQQQLQQQQLQQQAYQKSQQQYQHYPQVAYPYSQQQQQEHQGHSQQSSPRHHAQFMADHPHDTSLGYVQPYAHNPGYATPTRVQANPSVPNFSPRLNAQNLEWQQMAELQHASRDASALTSTKHRTSQTTPVVNMDTHPLYLSHVGQVQLQGSFMNSVVGRHSPSVNIVKPTLSSVTTCTSKQKSSKSDSNTQTNLSIIHKSASPKQVGPDRESASPAEGIHRGSSSATSPPPTSVNKAFNAKASKIEETLNTLYRPDLGSPRTSTSDKNMDTYDHNFSRESISIDQRKPHKGDTSLSEYSKHSMKDSTSESPSTSCPRLGVKMLGSHMSKNPCNIAVVQPCSGEKIETTFDTEVRTETVQKLSPDSNTSRASQGKETTFLTPDADDKATFVDDTGETMDIKPMPPIMRALPYGYFRGYSGYGGLNDRNFHIPGITVPTSTTSSCLPITGQGIGMPSCLGTQGPVKYYSDQMKDADSFNYPHSASSDPDYASESDTYDYLSGYMSDGDILKSRNNGASGGDEWSSGYLSEGGASLYARRLQQRFREGMQAVRECMQKSSGVTDDDSFDDSSSISSGDISDTLPEVSTDDNLTSSSQGALSDNPYSCLRRTPTDSLTSNGRLYGSPGSPGAGVYPSSSITAKRIPNLGTSSFMGTENNASSNFGPESHWGRKYSLPQPGTILSNDPNKLLSSDPSDYSYGYGWPSSRSDSGAISMRKMSSASNPDYGCHSEGDYESALKSFSTSPGVKKDTETNTEQSHLFEVSMRRLQAGKLGQVMSPGSGSSGKQFGYRRPLSNVSNSSGGGSRNSAARVPSQGSTTVGSRLAKHSVDNGQQTTDLIPRPASATDRLMHADVALNECYSSSSLDRKKTNIRITSSKSAGCAQSERDLQTNSLGRLRVFGNKNKNLPGDKPGTGPSILGGTIISNPHATFSRDKQSSHYVNLEELQNRISAASYASMDFVSSPRSSTFSTRIDGSGSMWLQSSTSTNGVGMPPPHSPLSPHQFHAHAMSDSETLESLAHSHTQKHVLQTRPLVHARMQVHHADMTAIPLSASPPSSSSSSTHCLQRSNSIKSDSAYFSTKFSSFNDDLPQTGSVSLSSSPQQSQTIPATVTFNQSSRFTFPMVYGTSMSPNSSICGPIMVRSNTQSSMPYSQACSFSRRTSKDEDASRLSKSFTMDYPAISDFAFLSSAHGSSLSLVSSSSSMFSSSEDKHSHEVRKLRRDLLIAQEKVQTLTNQLSTNAHVVSAFEQSLSSMTARLQYLTNNADSKASLPDTELNELRMTIEALKRQSKMTLQDPIISPAVSRRHTTPGVKNISIASLDAHFARQISSDSVSSINSLSSACSLTSQHSGPTDSEATKKAAKQAKKKGWLKSSFSKAFSRKKTKTGSPSEVEPDFYSLRSNVSAPNSPLLQLGHLGGPSMKVSQSSGALCDNDVNALKQALRDKDMKLTDTRLEALSSAHQLEQLRETMTMMKNEMSALKADNDRLHKLMSTSPSSRALNISHGPMSPHHTRSSTDSLDRSFSMTDHSSLDMLLAETAANDRDGKRVTISVVLGSNPSPTRPGLDKPAEVLIGTMSVSGKTNWDILDNAVRKTFKEHVLRVDPVTNLGLSAESIYSYIVGEITRTKESELPELLPIGYFVGETTQIEICLKGTKQSCVDSLAFETMIPKTVIQRYISLLLEHHRIILCGPSGTGKTYLAQKLAEHVVLRSGRELTAGSVATFNVDNKSAQELRQYLANIADQCENTNVHALPSAIILDNLHHVTSLADVFNGFMSAKYQKCPYMIGTISQSSSSTTNLQLHHNFRFVLCANHMEVKSFLGRFLRRRLIESELRTGVRNNDLNRVVDWIPKVWAHLNKALESHSSADVTIGPRLFMSCPMDIAGSQVWFTDLWNYTLVDTVRKGLQMYGCQSTWEDPTDWVLETYPWPNRGSGTSIMHIRVDDLGYEQPPITSDSSPTNKTKSPVTDSKDSEPLEIE